ncbi:MAG: anti-sigma factor family protein [Thermomicrobiales bacterium]|nr:hypothetical protein [Thermomicrobiales bacterium]
MPAREPGTCQSVAPLLARCNDPALNEQERVLLSLHLLGCPTCRQRIEQYRQLDRQLRTLPRIELAPRVRAAVFEQLALTTPLGFGAQAVAAPRPIWPGVAIITMVTALMMIGGLTVSYAPSRATTATAASMTTSDIFGSRPLANTLLMVNPTRVMENFSAAGSIAIATQPAALAATVLAVARTDNRLVVRFTGAGQDQRIIVTRDTAIIMPDGHPGSLADLAPGYAVRLRCDAGANGGMIAREIVLQSR